ncbi:Copine-8 [Chamberlinius hualienensis]
MESSNVLHSTVELSVSCRKLLDKDVFSKSDPVVALFMQPFGHQRWVEIDRTETIDNSLNPDFAHKFIVTFMFEELQKLKFEVYDVDSSSQRLEDHEFLGLMECSLGELVSSGSLEKPLCNRRNGFTRGTIIVTVEELPACKVDLTLQFAGKKLSKKNFFGKSDPFITISKSNEDGSYTVVRRTEYLIRNLNPTWKPFTISLQRLCNGDEQRMLKFECHDWNMSGNHKLIGEFYTNAKTLSNGVDESNVYELVNPAKKNKSGYQNSGHISLVNFKREQIFSFLDYIRGGTQLNCTIAIDFTASNGDPQSPNSLHYFGGHLANPYARALSAVGEIIQDYDSDKQFPVLGFGARLPPDWTVSHEFYVNGHPTNPYCEGVNGVINAYRSCLSRVQLHGPTNFASVINHVARFASAHQNGDNYFILLIVTDGIITDMPKTKDAIINCCLLPISIIIVGVGAADFTAMDELDGDVVKLSHRGRIAERDIVQFVPFREFERDAEPLGKAKLAKAVLAELPHQFISYMRMRNVKPSPPKELQHPAPPDPDAL